MAHAIDQTVSKQGSAMFVGKRDAVWHRLGVYIEKAATSAEAIKLAGLGWEVSQFPIRGFNPDNGQEIGIPGKVVNVRTDTMAALGVVSSNYNVFQNTDAFDFMDSIVGDKIAMYDTAGSLHGGKNIWMLAKIPKEYRVAKDDVVKPYVLLTTGHDGKSPVRLFATSVRVVCQNTLNLALRSDGADCLTINHFQNLDSKIIEARKKIGTIAARFDAMDEEMHAMISRQLKPAEVTGYFNDQLGKVGDSKLAKKLAENKLDTWKANFENERQTLKGVKGTAWAAYNAVSEWADHQKAFTGAAGSAERDNSQLNSIWFGGSAEFKKSAYADALALVK